MGGVVQITIPAGCHIDSGAALLAGRANTDKAVVTADFNGITLRAAPGDTAADIARSYREQVDEQAERYRRSPAGRAAHAAREAETARLQAEAIELVAVLPTLDFDKQAAVLAWLGKLQPCSDRIGVEVDSAAILQAFAAHDLAPHMCTGDEFNPEDDDSYFRWLVGQALSGLKDGPAIHGVFHHFAEVWNANWGAAA